MVVLLNSALAPRRDRKEKGGDHVTGRSNEIAGWELCTNQEPPAPSSRHFNSPRNISLKLNVIFSLFMSPISDI